MQQVTNLILEKEVSSLAKDVYEMAITQIDMLHIMLVMLFVLIVQIFYIRKIKNILNTLSYEVHKENRKEENSILERRLKK